MEVIVEGSSKARVEKKDIVDSKMPVFYNPVMRVNRDFTVLFLATANKDKLKIGLPLEGSGVRGLRLVQELKASKIKEILINDKKRDFKKYFSSNITLNKLSKARKDKFKVFNEDANIFLLNNKHFDYIDIDPFGTPNPFLDSAVQSVRNKGFLAVTATDISALAGTYPDACMRKYWGKPLKNHLMHEFGLRILIRKIQLVGAQHEKALVPLVSYSKDHYMRIFFESRNSRKEADGILGMHKEYVENGESYGPIWMGDLNNQGVLHLMREESKKLSKKGFVSNESVKLLEALAEETDVGGFGFFDAHETASKLKAASTPKFELILKSLHDQGLKASRTHFSETGIRTNAAPQEFEMVFEELLK